MGELFRPSTHERACLHLCSSDTCAILCNDLRIGWVAGWVGGWLGGGGRERACMRVANCSVDPARDLTRVVTVDL